MHRNSHGPVAYHTERMAELVRRGDLPPRLRVRSPLLSSVFQILSGWVAYTLFLIHEIISHLFWIYL